MASTLLAVVLIIGVVLVPRHAGALIDTSGRGVTQRLLGGADPLIAQANDDQVDPDPANAECDCEPATQTRSSDLFNFDGVDDPGPYLAALAITAAMVIILGAAALRHRHYLESLRETETLSGP